MLQYAFDKDSYILLVWRESLIGCSTEHHFVSLVTLLKKKKPMKDIERPLTRGLKLRLR